MFSFALRGDFNRSIAFKHTKYILKNDGALKSLKADWWHGACSTRLNRTDSECRVKFFASRKKAATKIESINSKKFTSISLGRIFIVSEAYKKKCFYFICDNSDDNGKSSQILSIIFFCKPKEKYWQNIEGIKLKKNQIENFNPITLQMK